MNGGDDPLEALARDPELARVARELRDERRAEAEEYEALAAKDLARGRRLVDVALMHCQRGDLLEVATASWSGLGRLLYAAGDLACLVTRTSEVDLWLRAPLGIRIAQRARTGGQRPGHGPETFKARLFEHEATGEQVTVGVRLPVRELEGKISAVAVDHLVMRTTDGFDAYVGLAAVDCVRRRRR